MGLPEVNQCCCGCTLQVGSTILGWLGLIGGIFSLIGGLVGIVSGNEHSTSVNLSEIIIGAIWIVASLLLLVGINKRVAKYVQLWVTIAIVSLVLTVIAYLIIGIGGFANGQVAVGVSALVSIVITVLLQGYFIVVVNSYKKELASETNQA